MPYNSVGSTWFEYRDILLKTDFHGVNISLQIHGEINLSMRIGLSDFIAKSQRSFLSIPREIHRFGAQYRTWCLHKGCC